MSKATAALSNELERQKILSALEANAQTALEIDAIVEATEPEPEPEPEPDPPEPPEPTPEGALYLDGQGWYFEEGDAHAKHLHCATLIPRGPVSGRLSFDIEVVVHRMDAGWSWDKLDFKLVTMTSDSKAEVFGNYKSELVKLPPDEQPQDGVTEKWKATIELDTRDLHDGLRAVKTRLRLKRSNGNTLGVTLGFLIKTANGNPKKDSKDSYASPPRLFVYGYYRQKGGDPIYASPNVYGPYPPNVAPDMLHIDYKTRSWKLGSSQVSRTIRHALRLDPNAHSQPPMPGRSLLLSGNLWDIGNASKSDTVDTDTTFWSAGVHHVVQIIEAKGQKTGSIVTGIMRLRFDAGE